MGVPTGLPALAVLGCTTALSVGLGHAVAGRGAETAGHTLLSHGSGVYGIDKYTDIMFVLNESHRRRGLALWQCSRV